MYRIAGKVPSKIEKFIKRSKSINNVSHTKINREQQKEK